jgi:type IV secretion system protein VirB5
MRIFDRRFLVTILVIGIASTPAAHAQWAVIDAPAIMQLVQEVQTMQQQLATARDQLRSAQQGLQAMTGDRGMAQLLSGTPRNYLPSNWIEVTDVLQGLGTGGYAGLSADVRLATTVNSVLSPQRLGTLSAADQQQIQTARQWSAMQQALTHAALANASNRFSAIQDLVNAISTASDQKAALDLQARISAELGMLQNEQNKVQALYQATQAQELAIREQATERVVEEHGQFETRFQPAP